jgi:hypothetical protein
MDHHGFMIGMLLGGALVALVPVLLFGAAGIYMLRQYRMQRRLDGAAGAEPEEGPL